MDSIILAPALRFKLPACGRLHCRTGEKWRGIPSTAERSIPEVLLAEGVQVPNSCGTGAARVIGGEPDHRDMFLSTRFPGQRFPMQLGGNGSPSHFIQSASAARGSMTGTRASLRIKDLSLTHSPTGLPPLTIFTSGFVARKLMKAESG
jgi:hypothetical protein